MNTLVLLLHIVVSGCWQYSATVTAYDMDGHAVTYRAPYWLCGAGSKPVTSEPVMPICFESGNPYGRVLYAHPAVKADVAWICSAE